jgi:hypothetical protein
MPSENDLEAVSYILESFFSGLYRMEEEKPLWFNSPNFSKWTMIAGFNFLCQLAIINKVDLEFLQTNIKGIWAEIEKSNTPSIVN